MEGNVGQQNQPSPSVSSHNQVIAETINQSPQTCTNCKEDKLACDFTIPCSSCIALNKASCCIVQADIAPRSSSAELVKTPSKRGYKSHVPSACINCKTAHLACDVSRPCQRCVTLKKTDTCQDIQHKKRGRPKLREKKLSSSNEHTYEILYGTIESPAFTMMRSTNRSIIPNNQVPPFKAKLPNIIKRPSAISFIHEPIESFQANDKLTNLATTVSENITSSICRPNGLNITETSVPLTFDYKSTNCNDNLVLETVMPSVQLTTNSQTALLTTQQQQQFLFQYSNSNLSNTAPILLNNGNIASNFKPCNNTQQQFLEPQNESDVCLSIIMSMEVCCAKVSDNTIKCWGYYPQELAHRSFYDFISPKDSDRLARLHRLLLDNAMGAVNNNSSNSTPLPSTERSTSLLFSNTDHTTLNLIANGSRSFSDSIHIKKRSGEYELYKVVVYIGGGLGADLYDATSFSKQYIVAQFRKHEYEVAPQLQLAQAVTPSLSSGVEILSNKPEIPQYNGHPMAVFSPLSPLSPESPGKNSIDSFYNSTQTKRDSLKDQSIFPVKNRVEKRLSATSKFSQMSIIPPSSPPKFHIAPITTPNISSSSQHSKHFNNSLFRRFPSSTSSSALQASSSVITSPSSVRMRSTDNAAVTHPTQQYFLQTSSSTLNAAASAAQSKSRLSISGPTNNDNSSTTNRKMEMSIRSLLC